MGCIYAHVLRVETSDQYGWMYIGQAENLEKRWKRKINAYRACDFIYRELKKYGWDNFDHIILEDNVPIEKLNEREMYWISKYHTYQHDPEYAGGFNLTPGGDGVRGPHMSIRGAVPKNIPMLAKMKHKKVKCINSGVWHGKEFKKDQTWNSVNECSEFFGVGRAAISHRLANEWNIVSGPVFAYENDNTTYDESKVKEIKENRKNQQKHIGALLSNCHKTGSRIDYSILCEETEEVFNIVSDCLKKFGMSRSTLNGHLIYPEKHKTAKGYHFKRIPKTSTSS